MCANPSQLTPLIGNAEYGWQFVGSDIDAEALRNGEHARASGNSQGSPGSSLPLASMVADGGYTTPADTRQQQEEQARHHQSEAHTASKDEWQLRAPKLQRDFAPRSRDAPGARLGAALTRPPTSDDPSASRRGC